MAMGVTGPASSEVAPVVSAYRPAGKAAAKASPRPFEVRGITSQEAVEFAINYAKQQRALQDPGSPQARPKTSRAQTSFGQEEDKHYHSVTRSQPGQLAAGMCMTSSYPEPTPLHVCKLCFTQTVLMPTMKQCATAGPSRASLVSVHCQRVLFMASSKRRCMKQSCEVCLPQSLGYCNRTWYVANLQGTFAVSATSVVSLSIASVWRAQQYTCAAACIHCLNYYWVASQAAM